MILYIIAIGLQFVIAYVNNEERLRDIAAGDTHQVNHALWLAVWSTPCIIIAQFNLKLAISIWLLHGCVFPVFYNLLAKLDPFNLSTTTTALYDRTLHKIGFRSMIIPDLLIFITSLFLLWLH